MDKLPEDFSLKYRWCEGSVPPPHYYEYSIRIGPGLNGVIDFYPDYPQHDLPAWVEHFVVDAEALGSLYTLMIEGDIFRPSWTAIENAPVGGSLEWLDISVGGADYKIPSMIEESSQLEQIFEALRNIVPIEIWKKLFAQREDFIREYPIE